MDAITLIILMVAVAALGGLAFYLFKGAASSNKLETALKWIKVEDYNRAIQIIKNVIAKNDSNSDAHFYLAECYFKTENYEWAMPEYKKVLRMNKYGKSYDEAFVRRRLAEIYIHYKQLEEAQKEFILVTQLDPNNHESFYEIAKIYINRGKWENASQFIKKAHDINPSHIETLYYSGVIHYELKQYSEALIEFEKCVNQDKNFFKANYYIGMINYNNKNYQKVLSQMELAERDKEFRLSALYQKGLVLFEMNEIHQAKTELEKAVVIIKEESGLTKRLRHKLAQCYEIHKDITAAIEQWEKIAEYDPDFEDVEEKLANYADLRVEDRLKDLFVASNDAFEKMCFQILEKLNMEVKETRSVGTHMAEFIAFESLGKQDVRTQKNYVRIYRHNEPISDKTLRDIVEICKTEGGGTRGLCISATGFSKSAHQYAETRPVNLISGKQLSDLMKSVNV